jgi:hypothetical protein
VEPHMAWLHSFRLCPFAMNAATTFTSPCMPLRRALIHWCQTSYPWPSTLREALRGSA